MFERKFEEARALLLLEIARESILWSCDCFPMYNIMVV